MSARTLNRNFVCSMSRHAYSFDKFPVRYAPMTLQKLLLVKFGLILSTVTLTNVPVPAFAQAPAPAPPKNFVPNGSFERSFVRDNLWDGVAVDGFLTLERDSRQALTERSNLGTIAMPPSLAAADLNGDGLADILAASPKGFVFAYFSSVGSDSTPTFTSADLVPIYLSVPEETAGGPSVLERRLAPRIALADWRRTAALDLIVGLYSGEMLYYPNFGNSRTPDYRQPLPFAKALVQTTDANRLWANLLAPAVTDVNRDGKLDILLGEGTYSANNIHLLLNSGRNSTPQFTGADRFYLAYGDGKEHLIPTVVDYNSDGFPDIIAGDRTGTLSVFLHPGASWKPGDEFKLATTISLGAQESQKSLIAPCAADVNRDGLFDLLIGRTSGRISLALNTGSKAQPKFETLTDIKGTDRWGRDTKVPSSWNVDTSHIFGNALLKASVVSVDEEPELNPAEGKSALKVSYLPPKNKVFQYPSTGIPGTRSTVILKAAFSVPNNASYNFSIKTRGASVRDATVTVTASTERELARKVTKLERGAQVDRKLAREEISIKSALGTGSTWSTYSKDLNVKFRDKNLHEIKNVSTTVEISFTPSPSTGVFYIDDVKLVAK